MNNEQIKISEKMQMNLAMREAKRSNNMVEKPQAQPQLQPQLQPPVQVPNLNELRSRQERLIAQQLLNVVDDPDVIKRVHKSLVLAYVKQMGLAKTETK